MTSERTDRELTDSQRLEFLVANHRHLRIYGSDTDGWSVADVSSGLQFPVINAPTFRAAIDAAAMAEGDPNAAD